MKKINFIFFIVVSVSLVSFDLYKASSASFTHDESFTYLNYVHASVWDIISYTQSYANNHILNTLLMKVFEEWFGNSELSLRLPNVLAHILYLLFSFLLFSRYCSVFLIPFFILANANPYLIDFFSLARGYGLAVGLMSAGLYYYCRFLENQKPKNHIFSLVLIGLAPLANFALLNVFVILIVAHNIFQFFIMRQSFSLKNLWQANKLNLLFVFLLSALYYRPIQIIIKDNLIIVGGTNGFWDDTISSLVNSFAYYTPYENSVVLFLKILIIPLSFFFLFKCIRYISRNDQINTIRKIALFFGMIVFFVVISTLVQHWLFATPFLTGRIALFMCPLYMFMGCFIAAETLGNTYKYSHTVFIFLLPLVFLTHTVYSLNTSWYYDWKYDMDTKKMLSGLNNTAPKIEEQKLSIGVSWKLVPSVNFYKEQLSLDWLFRVDMNGLKFPNNYFYVAPEDLQAANLNKTEVVSYFPGTQNSLIKYDNALSVSLKATNGNLVCADGDLNNIIIADRNIALEWETFLITRFENSKCVILSYNNLFWSAEIFQTNEITANRNYVSDWETFTLVELDSNRVAFKAFNGKYLSVDEKSFQLFARADSIGKMETFELLDSPMKW